MLTQAQERKQQQRENGIREVLMLKTSRWSCNRENSDVGLERKIKQSAVI
jgi:hypothetical protein